jgi:hypothetical protein
MRWWTSPQPQRHAEGECRHHWRNERGEKRSTVRVLSHLGAANQEQSHFVNDSATHPMTTRAIATSITAVTATDRTLTSTAVVAMPNADGRC